MLYKRNVIIIGFGDSITEAVIGVPDENHRWLNILRQKLSADFNHCEFTVINSGIGGNSAREAMARFEKDVAAKQPDFVILEFGGNNEDLSSPDRIVPLEEFKNLLNQYRQGLPVKTKTIIVTFPPVLDDLHAYGKNPAFKAHYQQTGGIDRSVEPYREITRELARKNGFPVYDLHRSLLTLGALNGRMTYTMSDGIHLTEHGNEILAQGVFEILKDLLQQTED